MRQIILDTETTGLAPEKGHRIIEIGALELVDRSALRPTAAKKPVKNIDLWQRLDEVLNGHQVHWRWVKGHSGVTENERADELARMAVPGQKR